MIQTWTWTTNYQGGGLEPVGYQEGLTEEKLVQKVEHNNTLNFFNTIIKIFQNSNFFNFLDLN